MEEDEKVSKTSNSFDESSVTTEWQQWVARFLFSFLYYCFTIFDSYLTEDVRRRRISGSANCRDSPDNREIPAASRRASSRA